MKESIDTFVSHIKEEIQKKYGHDILYAKDCQILSDLIQQQINRQVSVSTLKRFFGIIQSPFSPSKYTLDTLAIYLKFKNWQEYINSFENDKHVYSHQDSWEQLKKRARVITNYSLKSLKAKIADQLTDFPTRDFADNKFDSFLNSTQVATAFIAPGGFGKSTIVTQLTQKYFTGEDAKYPNDIICLVDGGILVNLINMNIELNRLHNLLEYDPKTSFSKYFRNHPDQVKGRFVLLIDGLNEIYYQAEKLTHFVENLMDIVSSYDDISWFKLLITCRPDNWKIFTSIIQKKPYLKSKWFEVSFENSLSDTINVPLLDKDEIKHFFAKKHLADSFENLNFHYPEITGIINNPYFLHLYNLSQNPEDIHSDIELLNQFVYKKVLSEPYLHEKSRIIDSFFHLSENAKQNTSVNKEDLPHSAELENAYNELVYNNILYEYTVPGSYLSVNTYVKFSHEILLEFFLANKWIKENSFDLNLFHRIINFYENNRQLQRNILKHLIKIAFKEGKTDILKDIYSIFNTEKCAADVPCICHGDQEIINVIGVELRKNKKLRDFLIPHYAKSKLGQLFYFESFFDMDCLVLHSADNINHYIENKHSVEAYAYGYFLKFLGYVFAGDPVRCKKEYERIRSLQITDNIKPSCAAYYYGAQIIYQSLFEDKLDKNLIESALQRSSMLFESGIQFKTNIPVFELIIVFSLNYGNRFKEILKVADLIFSRYELSGTSFSWRYQLFLSMYARALLNTGEVQKGVEVFQKVKMQNIPINYKCHVKLRFSLIYVEFLMVEKNISRAKQVIEEIKTISKMLRFKFFYDKALLLEKKICV